MSVRAQNERDPSMRVPTHPSVCLLVNRGKEYTYTQHTCVHTYTRAYSHIHSRAYSHTLTLTHSYALIHRQLPTGSSGIDPSNERE
jgi:hypothetical protein